MSKYVKQLITDELRERFAGINDALLVNISALDANLNYRLRKELRSKNIHVLQVKNSLARRATEGTALAPAFEGLTGSTALVWGAEDIVSLAKEVTRLLKEKEFAKLESRGGVMGGERISPEAVEEVSKWPSREEQLSILVGQILAPASLLASQLTSVSGALASQIQQLGEEKEPAAEAATAG